MAGDLGLAEFLGQIKQELLREDSGNGAEVPLLMLDDVEVEVRVTVTKEGKAGVNIQVVQVGGDAKLENVHTVRLHLSPLLGRDERLEELRRAGHWEAIVKQQVRGTTKGDASPRTERKS
jgi:hypothetical protein